MVSGQRKPDNMARSIYWSITYCGVIKVTDLKLQKNWSWKNMARKCRCTHRDMLAADTRCIVKRTCNPIATDLTPQQIALPTAKGRRSVWKNKMVSMGLEQHCQVVKLPPLCMQQRVHTGDSMHMGVSCQNQDHFTSNHHQPPANKNCLAFRTDLCGQRSIGPTLAALVPSTCVRWPTASKSAWWSFAC